MVGHFKYPKQVVLSVEVKSLISALVIVNPRGRLKVQGLLKHPWLSTIPLNELGQPLTNPLYIPNVKTVLAPIQTSDESVHPHYTEFHVSNVKIRSMIFPNLIQFWQKKRKKGVPKKLKDTWKSHQNVMKAVPFWYLHTLYHHILYRTSRLQVGGENRQYLPAMYLWGSL